MIALPSLPSAADPTIGPTATVLVRHISHSPVGPRCEQSELDGIVASQHSNCRSDILSADCNRFVSSSFCSSADDQLGVLYVSPISVIVFQLLCSTSILLAGPRHRLGLVRIFFFKDTAPRNGLEAGQS